LTPRGSVRLEPDAKHRKQALQDRRQADKHDKDLQQVREPPSRTNLSMTQNKTPPTTQMMRT
jgi:hypothetical protein